VSGGGYIQSDTAEGDADWGVLDAGAHWRHLANTTMCGGDAALCEITVHHSL